MAAKRSSKKAREGRGASRREDEDLRALAKTSGFKDHSRDISWLRSFKSLKAYVDRVGNAKVPFDYKDKKLANFVIRQRQRYKSGKLAAERVVLLNVIGFIWDPRPLPATGHKNVKYRVYDGYRAVCGTRNAQISKTFSFEQYGQDGSLRHAIKARRKMLKDLFEQSCRDPSISATKLRLREGKYKSGLASLRSGNPDNMLGIKHFRIEKYTAVKMIGGETVEKSFSIKQHGKKKAFELAKEFASKLNERWEKSRHGESGKK